jgi:predicted N-acyltransferase
MTDDAPTELTLRVHGAPDALPREAWNALLAASPQPSPFMRHEYLQALHDSGSATAATGWQPLFVGAWQGDELVGACPVWLKSHSWGEYVFDWAWADAYRRHGLHYYPKLLLAVPFTPVAGSRLLARDARVRSALLQGLRTLAHERQLSSIHLLFGADEDHAAALGLGWLERHGVQFHWRNRESAPYADFVDFLACLQREKRKKIQQEQRRVREAGVEYEVLQGRQIDTASWDFFYRCYTLTYAAHRSTPYLGREFFAAVAQSMPEHWLMFIARRGGERIAASLVALDPQRRRAFGRYWGATEPLPCLHFDACYYQPLAWCIAQRYEVFEGGAQGEHKMARGLLPVPTRSSHWLAHPQFREAVADFLDQEGQAMGDYVSGLEQHQPFKISPP